MANGGHERYLMYRLMLETPSRTGTVRSLVGSSFDLKGTPTSVAARYGAQKKRKGGFVGPLWPDLTTEPRKHAKRLLPAALFFRVPPDCKVLNWVARDSNPGHAD